MKMEYLVAEGNGQTHQIDNTICIFIQSIVPAISTLIFSFRYIIIRKSVTQVTQLLALHHSRLVISTGFSIIHIYIHIPHLIITLAAQLIK